MSLVLNGEEYRTQTPLEISQQMLDYINKYCADNNVLDSNGNLIQFSDSMGSAIWLILLAIGNRVYTTELALESASNALSIVNCDDDQLLHLCEIGRIQRKQATYSTIILSIEAAASTDSSKTVVITKETTGHIKIGIDTYNFTSVQDIIIPPGGSARVTFEADDLGPIVAGPGLFEFDTVPENIAYLGSSEVYPGSNVETLAQLRKRLQNRTKNSTDLDNANDAIASLAGISNCYIYFNNTLLDVTIGRVTVPARTCCIWLLGYSDDIAKTYLTYLTAPTVIDQDASIQNYTFKNGQVIPVGYFAPESIYYLVRVRIYEQPTDTIVSIILTALIDINQNAKIGQSIFARDLENLIEQMDVVPFTYIDITMSTDGISWVPYFNIQPNQIASLLSSNISVIQYTADK